MVILLAVAGISSAIAVYEATSQRNAAPWWTAAAAALILAVLIPAVWLGIHPLFASARNATFSQRDEARDTPDGSIRAGGDIAAGRDIRASGDIAAGWVSPEKLGAYLDEINKTMEARGFGRDADPRRLAAVTESAASWEELNAARVARYEANRGLFLVHDWRPSTAEGQVADVRLYVVQHRHGPLDTAAIKAIEYTLGPQFDDHSIVKNDPADGFAVNVSMHGPMLCLAKVYFADGSQPIVLERYVNFREGDSSD